jgi:hypothetical protein
VVNLTAAIHTTGGSNDTNVFSDSSTTAASDDSSAISEIADSVWHQFKGFKPNPTATFNVEFWRLSKHQGWNPKERRYRRIELFDADFEAHYGKEISDINKWHDLCRICSIILVPDTIPDCIDVCITVHHESSLVKCSIQALSNVLVNIYDLLDHQRTSLPIVPYDDFDDFVEYTLNNHMYPCELAKADTFLPVFLKDLNREEFGH